MVISSVGDPARPHAFHLRACVDAVADFDLDRDGEPHLRERRRVSWLTTALILLSSVKVAGALGMLAVHPASPSLAGSSVPLPFVAVQLTSFGVTGWTLLLAQPRDSRTTHLGIVLLLVASAFATSHYSDLSAFMSWAGWLGPLYPDAFLGYYLARFIATFPERRSDAGIGRAIRFLGIVAGMTGLVLFVANAVGGWRTLPQIPGWTVSLMRRSAGGTAYWTATFIPVLLLLPLALTGLRHLQVEERRRVRLFWTAFVVALGPLVSVVVLGAVPTVGPRLTHWVIAGWMNWLLHLLLSALPVSVAYAVLVKQVLPAKLALRQAIRYLLARWLITAAFVLPTVALATLVYTHRHETIVDASAGHMTWLVAIAICAGVFLLGREDLLRLLDRRFFREVYDAREVLVGLSAESRRVRTLDELIAVMTAGIDRALRPDGVAVMVLDQDLSSFVSIFGSVEPLSCASLLAGLLGKLGEPLDVLLEPGSILRWLPREERQWLVDNRSRLLVGLRASNGSLLGLLTLGERRSQLPFTGEDKRLLQAIADSGALTIESHTARPTGSTEEANDWWNVGVATRIEANECERCGRLESAETSLCPDCHWSLTPAEVPYVMFGKFRFDRRIGRGSMGVVYQARDLLLDRIVAIKTLPSTSPEYSQRLQLEARAMAAVTHANLATIHGAESWRGRPMLICEYMAHGTLARRLATTVLTPREGIALGIDLARALHVIHSAGLLHRDIKPSNIGYAHQWVPKLLDFGLVHMLTQGSSGEVVPSDAGIPDRFTDLSGLTLTHGLVGTPLYLSPEAISGKHPATSFDLWSLNVLLLEAVTGQHPFRGRSVDETLRKICDAHIEINLVQLAGYPHLAAYFERALGLDLSVRPQTASEMAEGLCAIAEAA